MRRIFLALAVAVLLVLLAMLFSRSSVSPISNGASMDAPSGKNTAPQDEPTVPVQELAQTARAALPQDAVPQQAAPASGNLVVKGLVRVVDQAGMHVVSARGSLDFAIHRADGSNSVRTAGIQDDRWTITVPEDAELEPTKLLWSSDSDSQYAEVEPQRFPASDAGEHTIVGNLQYGFILNVLDSETRVHVKGAVLVLAAPVSGPYPDTCYPPDVLNTSEHTTTGDSPLVLPNQPGTRVGWVRAPGYAWRRFAYSGKAGEVTVLLHRGADLEVLVTHIPPEFRSPCVQLFALDSGNVDAGVKPWAVTGLGATASANFAGIPPGRTQVVVVRSINTPCAESRLGEVALELSPSSKRSITIDLSSSEAVKDYGSIEVTVQHASSMRSSLAHIGIQRLEINDQPSIERYVDPKHVGKDGKFVALCEKLREAEYVVALLPGGPAERVALHAGTVAHVDFDCGATSELRVVAVDPDSRQPLSNTKVMYRRNEVQWPGGWEVLDQAGEGEVFRFRSAPGRLVVAAEGVGRETVRRDVLVTERDQELKIELPRARKLPIRVRAVQGEVGVQLPLAFWSAIRTNPMVADEGKAVGLQLDTKQVGALDALDAPSAVIFVNRPGRYRIEFAQVMGIRAPPPMLVDVTDAGGPDQVFTVEFD